MTPSKEMDPTDTPPPPDSPRESIRRELWALLVLYAALAIVPLLLGAVIV